MSNFVTSFEKNLLENVLEPIHKFLQEKEAEVELDELKKLFGLEITSTCVHKPVRSKTGQLCGKQSLPGKEYCKIHAKTKKEEKQTLIKDVPKTLNKGKIPLDLKNLPKLVEE